ncbi:MAG: hypothetical protein V5A23_00255 [Halobacteriales archaeon]
MTVRLPAAVLNRYERATLYNSPYAAHRRGHAVDLYPGAADGDARAGVPASTTRGPSPVGGTVRDVRTVRAPDRSHAEPHDHLILVDVDRPASAAGLVARIMHVDPAVEPGEEVAVGDDLGTLIRSGYYAPWVDNHVHLGFRDPDANLERASGSLGLALDVDLVPADWGGIGTVVAAGETYALLDAPAHPDPGSWAGVAADGGGILDGGLAHYDGGGLLGDQAREGPVSLFGGRVGTAASRDVAWDDVTVLANGEPVTGLSLFLARDGDFGAKLVDRERDFSVGEQIRVEIRRL